MSTTKSMELKYEFDDKVAGQLGTLNKGFLAKPQFWVILAVFCVIAYLIFRRQQLFDGWVVKHVWTEIFGPMEAPRDRQIAADSKISQKIKKSHFDHILVNNHGRQPWSK